MGGAGTEPKGSADPASFLLDIKYYYPHFSDEAIEAQEPPRWAPHQKAHLYCVTFMGLLKVPPTPPRLTSWKGRWGPELASPQAYVLSQQAFMSFTHLVAISMLFLAMLLKDASRPLGTNVSPTRIHHHHRD